MARGKKKAKTTFTCEDCGEIFTGASYLERHKLKHTQVKAFPCDICKKAFRTASHLKKHKETHIGLFWVFDRSLMIG